MSNSHSIPLRNNLLEVQLLDKLSYDLPQNVNIVLLNMLLAKRRLANTLEVLVSLEDLYAITSLEDANLTTIIVLTPLSTSATIAIKIEVRVSISNNIWEHTTMRFYCTATNIAKYMPNAITGDRITTTLLVDSIKDAWKIVVNSTSSTITMERALELLIEHLLLTYSYGVKEVLVRVKELYASRYFASKPVSSLNVTSLVTNTGGLCLSPTNNTVTPIAKNDLITVLLTGKQVACYGNSLHVAQFCGHETKGYISLFSTKYMVVPLYILYNHNNITFRVTTHDTIILNSKSIDRLEACYYFIFVLKDTKEGAENVRKAMQAYIDTFSPR